LGFLQIVLCRLREYTVTISTDSTDAPRIDAENTLDVKKRELTVHYHEGRLTGDPRRTIICFMWLGSPARARQIIERVARLDKPQVSQLVGSVLADFGPRHPDLETSLLENYREATNRAGVTAGQTTAEKLLIGAYFTMEYAFESAALFNPSMVPALDQSGLKSESIRFLMSLRAVGEGHLSSIVFRRGVINPEGEIHLEPVSPLSRRMKIHEDRLYEKHLFRIKLTEMGGDVKPAETVFGRLKEKFTYPDLLAAVEQVAGRENGPQREMADRMVWLARSNYEIRMPRNAKLPELVIFPNSETEKQGMEDMRLVRFVEPNGTVRYYGTYTAFDGHRILPQIMESEDLDVIRVHTLNGRFAQNKGMALFPRRLDGKFAMLARIDGENLYVMKSGNVHFWNEGVRIHGPRRAWDLVQIGNCGSPIETEHGWLVLTHGVGPMRRYCIGAMLLDLHDPTKIVGELEDPLIEPHAGELGGYVPNVVYSCGGMPYNGRLVIPYGISDAATGFASVSMTDLLDRLRFGG